MAESKRIVLFTDKDKCCACGACMNACPKQAIKMNEDGYGFIYPEIDYEKCISCGACNNVCAYQNIEETNTPIASYAAVNKNSEQKLMSASGGIFAALASKILTEGGVVYGAALPQKEDKFIPQHISVRNTNELYRLQGSKYVQSATGFTYKEVLEELKCGTKVMYSGTPCQIAGLKAFLKKDYDNLILIDLICHGVPNARFFNDYLNMYKKKKNLAKITGYSFRDKKKGWGMNCRIDAIDGNGKEKSFYTPARLASYNTLFLDGLTYRSNCYKCKYASKNRPGDITIGDYWGIANEHPEILGKNGFDEQNGISCVIANTQKGVDFCNSIDEYIELEPSLYEKISKMNKQLNSPSIFSPKRDKIMELYKDKGYEAIESLFKKKYKKQRIIHFVFNKLPRNLRNIIKRFKDQ